MVVDILTNGNEAVMRWTVEQLLMRCTKMTPREGEKRKPSGLRTLRELRLTYSVEEAKQIQATERRHRCKMLMRQLRRRE